MLHPFVGYDREPPSPTPDLLAKGRSSAPALDIGHLYWAKSAATLTAASKCKRAGAGFNTLQAGNSMPSLYRIVTFGSVP